MKLQSLYSQLQNDKSTDKPQHLFTFCKTLDEALGGGISRGCITEVAGESGSGKTQLAFQLSVSVQIPSLLGGYDGEAVFVDTENTFITNRVAEIASAVLKECNKALHNEHPAFTKSVGDFLAKIYLFRCLTSVELLATSHQLRTFIDTHPKVQLVVVDSIANSLRSEEDMRTRTVLLNQLALNFRKLAHSCNIAVVIVNQVTSRFSGFMGKSGVFPALGESWSYVAAEKIMLFRNAGKRQALLYKSRTQPRALIEYTVTTDGIRDFGPEKLQDFQYLSARSIPPMSEVQKGPSNAAQFTEVNEDHVCEYNGKVIERQEISESWIQLSQRQLNEVVRTGASAATDDGCDQEYDNDQSITTDLGTPSPVIANVGNKSYQSTSSSSAQPEVDPSCSMLNICPEPKQYDCEPPSSPILASTKRKKRKRSSK